MEYPEIKSSWWKRLRFEYNDCLAISKQINPRLWLAMHDITPRVRADIRAVYCHNPAPFYPFSLKEALLDWKFGFFTVLYRFLYGINIKANNFVVVQQDWLRNGVSVALRRQQGGCCPPFDRGSFDQERDDLRRFWPDAIASFFPLIHGPSKTSSRSWRPRANWSAAALTALKYG